VWVVVDSLLNILVAVYIFIELRVGLYQHYLKAKIVISRVQSSEFKTMSTVIDELLARVKRARFYQYATEKNIPFF